MNKFKEVVRLHYEGQLKQRQIARAVQVGLGTVNHYLHQAEAVGLT